MKKFDYSLVKDPQYFCDGRMEAHSDHMYYRSEEEREDEETSYRHSLNGLWKFHYARNYASTVAGFEEDAYSCKDWEDIYVPAHIQMDMMYHSMPMSSIHGKVTRNFTRDRSRSVLTRWEAM